MTRTTNPQPTLKNPNRTEIDFSVFSEDGENYHPIQDASELVSKPRSGKGVLVEAFFGTKNENTFSVKHAANLVVNELLRAVDSVSEIGVIYTGINGEFTNALQHVVDSRELNITVEVCYANVQESMNMNDTEYRTAWEETLRKRNKELAEEHVDIAAGFEFVTSPGCKTFVANMNQHDVETTHVDLTHKF